jgi:iron complex outermembrane receptor protein
MMEKVLSRSIRLICLGGVTLGMHAAYAQTAVATTEAPMQRVEVTGSRIRQVDLETAQPISVMTAEQIQKTGLVTVGDILNNMAAAGSPDFSKGGSLTSNRENGGQYANLRNLGSNRLLVLVDGKRWTASVNGFTDLSTIPSALIDRIEVLKDGASSIYGSDAIAGVVNIILKKTMEGGALSAYMGQNDKGDGKAKDFSVTYGANSDKASLLFGLTHTEQGAVWARDRAITATSYGPDHFSDGFGTGPWGRIAPVNPATGGALTSTAAGGFNRYLNHTGTYDGRGVGAASNNAANYHAFAGADADTFNSSQQMMFQMPTKLDSFFTKGTVELPYGMKLSSTAMFAQRNSDAQVAGYPLNSMSQSSYPVYVDKNSYYNPYGNAALGGTGGQDLFFYRRTIEVPRVTSNENRTTHIDAALSGDFTLANKAFNWDVGYNHSSVSGTVTGTGNLNLLNLKKALGPSFMNASGQVQCGSAAAPIALAECTPFNILGGPSASTPAALAYVMSTGQATYGSTTNSATANIGGELFQMPGNAGPFAFAAGLEHREVTGSDLPGQFEQSGYSTDLAGNSTVGRYTVKEAYLELAIPVLKDLPFAKLLSFDVATRHSDYSNFGITNNSKFSFMWKPFNDLLTRGTWAEGFRAPTVGDTFGGGQQSFDYYLDPCDSRFGAAASNTGVAARCAAAGVPAGFRQLNQNGVPITGATETQGAYPFQSGAGNASLQPETSVSKTLGVVYSPSYLTGATVSLDWYDIRINNRITGISATNVANQCYQDNVASFCSSIQRNAAGEITNLAHGNANLGQLEVQGLDAAIGYRFPTSAYGRFNLRSEISYTKDFKVKSAADAEWVNYAGEYYYNRIKANAALDWSLGNWSATWMTRYYSAVKDQCWDTEDLTSCSNPTGETSFSTGYNRLGALVYHDVNVGYKLPWKGQIQVGVNNVLDKKPRITFNGTASSSSVDADLPIDRFVYVRYNQAF